MIAFPTRGMARSITKHQSRLETLCDWIEGCIAFDEKELSTTDVVDALVEEQFYTDQGFAANFVENAWAELRRRRTHISHNCIFSVSKRRVVRVRPWRDAPAHSFCILLSMARWHIEWAQGFGQDYTEQGELFELLTKESLDAQFSGWEIHHTGWSRTTNLKLAQVVEDVARRLGELQGPIKRWANPDANEAGLDLLCYRPFPDKRVGIPVYLMQCASGKNWEKKRKEPDLELWNHVIQFAVRPKRAFAIPFSLGEDAFLRTCGLVDGLVIDRSRLLPASAPRQHWISRTLRQRLVRWARPRILALPRRRD